MAWRVASLMNRSLELQGRVQRSQGLPTGSCGRHLVATQPALEWPRLHPHTCAAHAALCPSPGLRPGPRHNPQCSPLGSPGCGGDQSSEAWGCRSWEVRGIGEPGHTAHSWAQPCTVLQLGVTVGLWILLGPGERQGAYYPTQGGNMEAQRGSDPRSLTLWVQLGMAPTPAPSPHLSTKTCGRGRCSRTRQQLLGAEGCSQVPHTSDTGSPSLVSVSVPAAEPWGAAVVRGWGTRIPAHLPSSAAAHSRLMCRAGAEAVPGNAAMSAPGARHSRHLFPAPGEREFEHMVGGRPA